MKKLPARSMILSDFGTKWCIHFKPELDKRTMLSRWYSNIVCCFSLFGTFIGDVGFGEGRVQQESDAAVIE